MYPVFIKQKDKRKKNQPCKVWACCCFWLKCNFCVVVTSLFYSHHNLVRELVFWMVYYQIQLMLCVTTMGH